MIAPAPLSALAEREVEALHEFFVAWFLGRNLADLDFSLVERVLAADFRMIAPDGSAVDRRAVIAALCDRKGTAPDDFAISILDLRPVWQAKEAVLLEFVERQYRGGRTTQRQSTALFTAESSAPRGVVWRHLQETWVDDG